MPTDTIDIRVRPCEAGPAGSIHYAQFLTYFEVARTEYLRHQGRAYADFEAQGIYLVVVEAHCRYFTAARGDDVLEITSWVDRTTPARINFRHSVRRKGDGSLIGEGRITLACINGEGRPRPLPAEMAQGIVPSRL